MLVILENNLLIELKLELVILIARAVTPTMIKLRETTTPVAMGLVVAHSITWG